MPPNPKSIPQLCRETGVSDVTLYKWRKSYRNKGVVAPGDKSKPENWTAGDKLAVVIETAPFNEVQLSEYCRSKGLYKEQIVQWKIEALSGYERSTQVKKAQSRYRCEDKEKIKKLERELNRKEKALAETAALLVLSVGEGRKPSTSHFGTVDISEGIIRCRNGNIIGKSEVNMNSIHNNNLEGHFDIDRTRWKIIYGSTRFFEHLGMHKVFDLISIQVRIVTVK